MSLSRKLRELLFEKNITAAELAKQSGVPSATIHRMITGKTQHPNVKALESISNFFGVSVADLSNANYNLANSNHEEFRKIPILEWDQLNTKMENISSNKKIIVSYVSENAFALEMQDNSMKPFVEKGSLLIFDPEVKISDRSYCLIKVNKFDNFMLRQVLIDMENIFIKSINKDIGEKSIRLLSNKDTILAKLVEIRVKIE